MAIILDISSEISRDLQVFHYSPDKIYAKNLIF